MKTACFILIGVFLGGCSGVYYDTMEKIGYAKREILADRIVEARKAQDKAKTQFADALHQFLAITQVQTGDLGKKYEKLNAEFKKSETRAADVNDRIAKVEDVADALFKEWHNELKQYSDRNLREQSERQYEDTRQRYHDLLKTMKAAAKRMDPILAKFRDQVLFLKHNLNAQAVAGLSSTAKGLEADVTKLISEMENSISEADAFIRSMQPAH
ncbi:MAG: DUF2959 domain-containing protein [Nibricoccus sp.]